MIDTRGQICVLPAASLRVRLIEADSRETGSAELRGKMGVADGGGVMGCLMVGKIKDGDALSWSTKLQSCSNHGTHNHNLSVHSGFYQPFEKGWRPVK